MAFPTAITLQNSLSVAFKFPSGWHPAHSILLHTMFCSDSVLTGFPRSPWCWPTNLGPHPAHLPSFTTKERDRSATEMTWLNGWEPTCLKQGPGTTPTLCSSRQWAEHGSGQGVGCGVGVVRWEEATGYRGIDFRWALSVWEASKSTPSLHQASQLGPGASG